MRTNLARWRPNWLPSLRDDGPTALWRIGYALAACFAAALVGLAVLWLAVWALLGGPSLVHSKALSVHDAVSVAQLVFASVAGAGALVALVMAYRRQRVAEVSTLLIENRDKLEQVRWQATETRERTRLLNERFTAIAAQLGSDQAAVRLAGVHAMAGLADDWEENRQTCIDVLCAYLRMPYEPYPSDHADLAERMTFRANREVRHTVIRVITAHLQKDSPMSWQGMDLDFTGAVFDGGDFRRAQFTGGIVSFDHAEFISGEVDFYNANFSGGSIDFDGVKFSGARVNFTGSVFSGAYIHFYDAEFSDGEISFRSCTSSGDYIGFVDANFSGGTVDFGNANFTDGGVDFGRVRFSGGVVDFGRANFSGSNVGLEEAVFSGSSIGFQRAKFSGGSVDFDRAKFNGGTIDFSNAEFSGGIVNFERAADWSHPPRFDFATKPPSGLRLPAFSSGT